MANTLTKGKPLDSTKPITCIVVGAGNRGQNYVKYALHYPDRLKLVGIAEPREFQRNREVKAHSIPPDNVFTDWREAVTKDKFADFVIITTVDKDHKDPAVAFAKKGYHILLEKPMAVSEAECREIVSTCKEHNVLLVVCHVLRYIPWAKKIREIIQSGRIGDVVNITHKEPVGFWHFAHSFVRGNWGNEAKSSNSLLAKCCHDVDLIKSWMGDKKCQRLSSFGHLTHFRAEDKPEGAASRCMECPQHVETQCPYSAKRLYLDMVKSGHRGWPVSVIADVPDIENVTKVLKTGPYGRCVYECDNDVMSHQVVNFQFEGGATATLTMVAFTKSICAREVHVHGTKGEISYYDGQYRGVKVFDFLTEQTFEEELTSGTPAGVLGGHGGADYHLMHSFVTALRENNPDLIETGADDTLSSHLLVFAAEKARKENCVVTVNSDGSF